MLGINRVEVQGHCGLRSVFGWGVERPHFDGGVIKEEKQQRKEWQKAKQQDRVEDGPSPFPLE